MVKNELIFEFLAPFSNSVLNVGLEQRELHLISQDLALLLLQCGLSLLQGRLPVYLFNLLPLVEEGAVSLSDLLHDVLNLIGRVLFSSLTSSSWRTVSL